MHDGERLQKVLARAGVASRRAAEQLITSGRVSVNGEVVTELGTRVDPGRDVVRVDGRAVLQEEPVYYAFHKPPGMITSMEDPEGRPHVGQVVADLEERVYPVGRLDWDAEGLLLLTNDGELAHRLTHPRFEMPRVYEAKVRGDVPDAVLETLAAGIRLEDGPIRPVAVERAGFAQKNTWIRVTVTEGRPHLVKRLFAAVGHPVQRLRRMAYAGIELDRLGLGDLRALTPTEVRDLKDRAQTGGEAPARGPSRRVASQKGSGRSPGGGRTGQGAAPGRRGDSGGGRGGSGGGRGGSGGGRGGSGGGRGGSGSGRGGSGGGRGGSGGGRGGSGGGRGGSGGGRGGSGGGRGGSGGGRGGHR